MEEIDVAPPVICCVFLYGTRKKWQVSLSLAIFVTSFSVMRFHSTGYGHARIAGIYSARLRTQLP